MQHLCADDELVPRMEFEAAVREHQGARRQRGFEYWTQFIAMMFCQLGRAQSLAEITKGLAASEGKLKHLGVGAEAIMGSPSLGKAAANVVRLLSVMWCLCSGCRRKTQSCESHDPS